MQTKTCKRCAEVKNVDQFQKEPRHRDGLKSNCRPCETARKREWREKNPDKHRASVIRNRPARKANAARWREENPDRWSAHCGKLYATSNYPDCLPDDFDFDKTIPFYAERDRLIKRDGPRSWHVDHIVPLSKGGKHHHDNLQVITQKENIAKGNTTMQYEHRQNLFLFPDYETDEDRIQFFDEVAENSKDIVTEYADQHLLDRALEKDNLSRLVVSEDAIEFYFN